MVYMVVVPSLSVHKIRYLHLHGSCRIVWVQFRNLYFRAPLFYTKPQTFAEGGLVLSVTVRASCPSLLWCSFALVWPGEVVVSYGLCCMHDGVWSLV